MPKTPETTWIEEHEFWKTHDAIDYLDDMEPVPVNMGARPQNHCSVCGRLMLSNSVDMDWAGGRAQLRDLRQLYCPEGHETYLAREAQRLVDAIEAVVRLDRDSYSRAA